MLCLNEQSYEKLLDTNHSTLNLSPLRPDMQHAQDQDSLLVKSQNDNHSPGITICPDMGSVNVLLFHCFSETNWSTVDDLKDVANLFNALVVVCNYGPARTEGGPGTGRVGKLSQQWRIQRGVQTNPLLSLNYFTALTNEWEMHDCFEVGPGPGLRLVFTKQRTQMEGRKLRKKSS